MWEVLREIEGTTSSRQLSLPTEEDNKLKQEIAEREHDIAIGCITLEEELEKQTVQNMEMIEKGLKLRSRQRKTNAGVIDILAKDQSGSPVVIELKAVHADEKALVQLLKYMAAVEKASYGRKVKGILLAHEFSEGIRLAASKITYVGLKIYDIKIEITDVM